ncbi:hypothetical protein GUITHDRAFT_74279 [Guillardia theta CCMP2712]|uniref:GST N-terminal domain-containing protein n=2 Tax=Guillardia theta TaxID=55529 RepID=L1J173_GUITC|nr:hypothetical protein GUITHDRAFT_74279 [Guillardia theta CCMP2712]EKX42077.1 hypothetical protein GUITHDRAFT_74279 [Guillardia theta CCMP2712]|eukprot:XP_005829057.1 hypothetical protein GUITHDRAFT_74279 [Guillardia theta CCMP2712]
MELPVREFSETLPSVKPKKPLELYEFEACPFCRKVREVISMLDLDVMIYPCPRDGDRFRPQVVEMGGKAQFPYLVDPNTDFKSYESDKIIKYLVQTYGDGIIPLPLSLGPLTTASASIPSLLRNGRGRQAEKSLAPQPELPLRLWSFESSPYCRIVRERLCELQIPYQLFTVARGSRKREELKEIAGKVQVPYLVDPNTGKSMFESSSILDYLNDTYGKGYSPKVEDKVEEVSPRAVEFNVVPEDPEPVKVDAEVLEDSEDI